MILMNAKNTAYALITALSYEVVLKICRTFTPSLFEVRAITGITSVLSLLVGLVIIIFLFIFYRDNRVNRGVARLCLALIACFVLRFLLRLPTVRGLFGFQTDRLLAEGIGFLGAVLLLAVVLAFRRSVPAERRPLRQAASMLAVLLAVGVATAGYALYEYARFMSSGSTADHPASFYRLMFFLFILTHAAAIYFLLLYSRGRESLRRQASS
jgi:hypothetical protein